MKNTWYWIISYVLWPLLHDVYNTRMAETKLATDNYVWPAAVETQTVVKT